MGWKEDTISCEYFLSHKCSRLFLISVAEVEMTTTAEADGPSQVDTHQLRMLAVAFGLLFGITLLALIAVTAIFVIYVIWNNRKKKGSLDIPPTE